ncbi:MAG: adenylyl-sulfate kinase [Burkholderiales bacterium PBB4]|nr:MAG: adenylyl-sulfate kinase [Burkholderiales bacterium PBB4]
MTSITPRTWWFTGLSGAGKTTLSHAWAHHLHPQPLMLLDGDELRRGLCSDLGFSDADRLENVRRVAHIARLANAAGLHALVALVSPSRDGRTLAKEIVGGQQFREIYVSTPLEVCQQRDTKGLYRRARNQEPIGLTGVQSPYEAPCCQTWTSTPMR